MKIHQILASGQRSFSFEFFPPKTEAGKQSLFRAIAELEELQPTFVSVTYGAGGSTRQGSLEVVEGCHAELRVETMAHLACLGHSRAELRALLGRLRDRGIENLLALRGDPPGEPPAGGAPSLAGPLDDGLRYASELVELIRADGFDFSIGAACYPEGHVECPDRRLDLANLRRKVDAGVDFLITQLFLDNAFYFDFVARARQAGIAVPIIPGIMPITNVEQIERFTTMCNATIPMRLEKEMNRRRDDGVAVLELGVAHATVQCVELLERGAPGIHFYTLNRSPATRMILTALRGLDDRRGGG